MFPKPVAALTPNTLAFETTPLVKPTPLFAKLDEKLGQTGPDWAPVEPVEAP